MPEDDPSLRLLLVGFLYIIAFLLLAVNKGILYRSAYYNARDKIGDRA